MAVHRHDDTERVEVEERHRHERPRHRETARSHLPLGRAARLPGSSFFEALLLVRFVLQLGDANTTKGVAASVYAITERWCGPLRRVPGAGAGGPAEEIATLLAIVFLLLVEALAIALLRAFGPQHVH